MADNAVVKLWGSVIGAVSWDAARQTGVFQYDEAFVQSGIEVSPLTMPLRTFPYEFPQLNRETFNGLPGLLSDSLPDRFGNAVIDAWLLSEGRSLQSFHPVERLCYMGTRGMGALEFEPAMKGPLARSSQVDVARMVALATSILRDRKSLTGTLEGGDSQRAIQNIIRIGTSAGGARAKAVLAWNPATGAFRSGQIPVDSGFEYWIMKFDGVIGSGDHGVADPQGYGKIEYAYHLMALEAGIEMAPCRLYHEGGRSHFMTRRFDRNNVGGKLHMQTLGSLAHLDYSQPAMHSYEQAIQVMRRLKLPRIDLEQQVLRAYFNIVCRNQDDHVKNIAFLMDRQGQWRLSPAYDVIFAWHPEGRWTSQHQMSVNGKRDGFEWDDLSALAITAGIKPVKARGLLEAVNSAARQWPRFAAEAGVEETKAAAIHKCFREL